MDLSTAAVLKPAHRYRLPALLQDIRLLDLLEISGTTLEARRICGLSQPTVSRRSHEPAGVTARDRPFRNSSYRKTVRKSRFCFTAKILDFCDWPRRRGSYQERSPLGVLLSALR